MMGKGKWAAVFAVVLLLIACASKPDELFSNGGEQDSFHEEYHLTKPVEDDLRQRVIGIKACLDWMVGKEPYEFSVRPDSEGTLSLLAHNELGEGISILSQIPMPDGSYEVYSSTEGTYDAVTRGFVATRFSTLFFYETQTGRLIPSHVDGEENPEYRELYDL